MKVTEHSYEVSKFIKFLKDKESRRNNKDFDTSTIFKFALNEYKLRFRLQVGLFVVLFLSAFISFILIKDSNRDLADYLFLEILFITYGIVIYFPKFIPNLSSFYNIKFKKI